MKKDKREISIIRSSAAEYLTFLTATGESDVNAVYADENVWLTQKMMGLLYNVETHTINYHLKKIFADGEIDETSVIRKFRITAADGKTYNTNHYNLSAIIAVGNKVDSPLYSKFLYDAVCPFSELHRTGRVHLVANSDDGTQIIGICFVGFTVCGSYSKFSNN